MGKTAIKLVTAGVLLAGGVGFLAYAGMKEGWTTYHVTVDQYVSDAQYQKQKVRLAGQVAEEGLEHRVGRLGAQFQLKGAASTVPVSYKGIVPDLFKANCEVVVEGRMGANGVFQAELLMTKCASKYESGEHGGKALERAKQANAPAAM